MSGKECFQTSIREYDTIRSYLYSMYLYGCCTKKYMTSQGLASSARKFEEDTRRTRAIIPGQIDETLVARRKSLRINVSALDVDDNFLAASYFIRAFGKYDFALHFAVLLILAETPEIGFTALTDQVNKLVTNDEIISDATIRRFLSQMVDQGLIVHKRKYSLPPDPFAALTNEEIGALMTAVGFYKNIRPLGILGEYVYDALVHYARFSRRMHCPAVPAWIFRYRHLERIVDDDTLLPLMHCIRTQKKARYTYKGKTYTGFPRQIRYDTLYGRQYVVIHNEKQRYLLPITHIRNVCILPDTREQRGDPAAFLRHAWFAANPREGKKPAIVRAWFHISEDVPYLLERLQREKRHGTLSAVSKGTYLFEIKLSDPLEILPWLRSFLGYVVIEQSTDHDLHEQYTEYVAKMRALYGV